MQNIRPWAYAVDVVCVLVFAAVGRSSHAEGVSLGGLATTAGPFVVGLTATWLAATWLAARQARPVLGSDPFATVRRAWALPAGTWALAMALRLASGQGVSGAFPLVALGFLTLTLVGWRAAVHAVRTVLRRSGPGRSAAPAPGTPGRGD